MQPYNVLTCWCLADVMMQMALKPFVAKGTAVVVKAIADPICKSQTLQLTA